MSSNVLVTLPALLRNCRQCPISATNKLPGDARFHDCSVTLSLSFITVKVIKFLWLHVTGVCFVEKMEETLSLVSCFSHEPAFQHACRAAWPPSHWLNVRHLLLLVSLYFCIQYRDTCHFWENSVHALGLAVIQLHTIFTLPPRFS